MPTVPAAPVSAAPRPLERRLRGPARAALVAVCVWASALACGGARAQAAMQDMEIDTRDRGTGVAVVIGGNLASDHEAVWQRMVALAGGAGSRWVVLGTASESPLKSAEQAAEQLRRRGAVAEVLPVSPMLKTPPVAEAVRDADLVARVRAARGVFFTGGSQSRIVDHLYPGGRATPLLQAIWQVYRAGGVVAGTSAGAAIMSTTMFRDAPSPLRVMQGQWSHGQEVDRGLGFLGPRVFVDQHFLRRGRIARMLPLMQATGYRVGLGVEENSAAVVRGEQVEVYGQVLVADLRAATQDTTRGAFQLSGARLSLLDSGDAWHLARMELLPSPSKQRGQILDPAAKDYQPYYTDAPEYADFLSEHTLATAMTLLIDGQFPEIRGLAFSMRQQSADQAADAPAFEFRLYKGPGSFGWYSEDSGGEDYTVREIWLDVNPVRMARPLLQPWRP